VVNFWLNKIVNLLYRTRYSDLCYGYNAFWRDCLEVFDLDCSELSGPESTVMRWGDGFEVETLINVRIAKAGLEVVEVPSYERQRVHGISNLNAFSDGFRVLRIIQTERQRWRSRSGTVAANAGCVPARIASSEKVSPRDCLRADKVTADQCSASLQTQAGAGTGGVSF
jgi:hypothetical protein